MQFRKFRFVVVFLVSLFTFQETSATPPSREPVKTEIVVNDVQQSPFRKIIRNVFLTFLIVLALCGIPVAPPRQVEMDVDDKIKKEIVEGSEDSQKD